MLHADLYSGIGGFSIAAQQLGWQTIFHCEIDEFCQRVLRYHFPTTKLYDDIKETNFKEYKKKIDIVSAGMQCQPFSVCGQRKGAKDDRFLWHETLRAIQEIEPKWVVIENVRGIITQEQGLVFEQICSDLENENY
ncbi:MAG: DNA (cytosine-5-)-methyltransferase, partial [Firmicutes bacterium]|nr:DNA (cytosine-5-)-methyltransferase [Bacillota bacterium]